MKKIWFLLAIFLCSATTSKLCADQAADEAAIRKNVDAYVGRIQQSDAKKLASFWSPDAVYLNPETGDEVVGHQAITDQFAAILATVGDAKLAVDVKSVVFISPTVAVERGTARVVTSPARNREKPTTRRYTSNATESGSWIA